MPAAALNSYRINGAQFKAEDCRDDVLINPKVPPNFDNTANESRPAAQRKWWGLPYVTTYTTEQWDRFYSERTDEHAEAGRKHWEEARPRWLEAWPSGTRYEVRMLDGGAWDRSTSRGMFKTLEEAIEVARGVAGSVWMGWPGR